MRYASGKTRISGQIALEIQRERERESNTFVSLFCGGLSVETKLQPFFQNMILNDKQEYLIELYKAIQNGWLPPDNLSEDEYYYIKNHKEENKALTAFAGFGCSFGGKWFGGYGRHGMKDEHDAKRNMCKETKMALCRDLTILKDATFTCLDYKDVEIPKGSVVYADPPYKDKMAAFGLTDKFNSDEFWEYMREISKDNKVFVSELSAPNDFESIWERPVLRQLDNCNANMFKSTEKLFVYKGN